MIDKLQIKNIQSHKNSELEFVPGINVIIGSSNNGKSAILRALYWAIYNRPLGIEILCSHWAINNKGNIIEPMSVKVFKNGNVLERRRSKTENQYLLNGEELNVVSSDVPEQVANFFKLSNTNIQNQQESPFLLSLSNGEIARYFNKIANLDIIDRILSNAESKRREIKKEVENNDKILQELLDKHEKFTWVKQAEKKVLQYEKLIQSKEDIENRLNEINSEIEKRNIHELRIKDFKKVLKNKNSISNLQIVLDSVNELTCRISETVSDISEYKKIIQRMKKISKFKDAKVSINEIKNCLKKSCDIKDELANLNSDLSIYTENEVFAKLNFKKQLDLISKISNNSCKDLRVEFENLGQSIENYKLSNTRIENANQQIISLKNKLPEVCPLCGGKMKNGVCHEIINNG